MLIDKLKYRQSVARKTGANISRDFANMHLSDSHKRPKEYNHAKALISQGNKLEYVAAVTGIGIMTCSRIKQKLKQNHNGTI